MAKERTKFCQHCGKKIAFEAEICPKCGVRVAPPPSTQIILSPETIPEMMKPGAAIIRSFIFPGLGQRYLGEKKKGKYFMIFAVVSIILMPLIIGFFIYFIVWIANLIDCLFTMTRIKEDIRSRAN